MRQHQAAARTLIRFLGRPREASVWAFPTALSPSFSPSATNFASREIKKCRYRGKLLNIFGHTSVSVEETSANSEREIEMSSSEKFVRLAAEDGREMNSVR
jgi:hypothetical protein